MYAPCYYFLFRLFRNTLVLYYLISTAYPEKVFSICYSCLDYLVIFSLSAIVILSSTNILFCIYHSHMFLVISISHSSCTCVHVRITYIFLHQLFSRNCFINSSVTEPWSCLLIITSVITNE